STLRAGAAAGTLPRCGLLIGQRKALSLPVRDKKGVPPKRGPVSAENFLGPTRSGPRMNVPSSIDSAGALRAAPVQLSRCLARACTVRTPTATLSSERVREALFDVYCPLSGPGRCGIDFVGLLAIAVPTSLSYCCTRLLILSGLERTPTCYRSG